MTGGPHPVPFIEPKQRDHQYEPYDVYWCLLIIDIYDGIETFFVWMVYIWFWLTNMGRKAIFYHILAIEYWDWMGSDEVLTTNKLSWMMKLRFILIPTIVEYPGSQWDMWPATWCLGVTGNSPVYGHLNQENAVGKSIGIGVSLFSDKAINKQEICLSEVNRANFRVNYNDPTVFPHYNHG